MMIATERALEFNNQAVGALEPGTGLSGIRGGIEGRGRLLLLFNHR